MSAYTARAAQSRYVTDAVTTASPSQLVVMLFDRLVLDLARAEAAHRAGARERANEAAVHAQEILHHLSDTLDLTAWPEGSSLAALYTWLVTEVVSANVRADGDRLAACRAVVEPLRDTWREAASSLVPVPAASTFAGVG